jgi:hypothetical protein
MKLVYSLDEKPREYSALMVSFSAVVLMCGILCEQTVAKKIKLSNPKIWIENKKDNSFASNIYSSPVLASTGTGSVASVVGIVSNNV